MVALYNSYRTPFIIMFAVPVAVVGALGSLALTHQTLNLFSLIGSVLLIGLVTKNGILLVDFANTRRRDGLERIAAIREAARERFRPIMMTTVAMVAGMIPLALALDPGAQAARSLGTVVIGGLDQLAVADAGARPGRLSRRVARKAAKTKNRTPCRGVPPEGMVMKRAGLPPLRSLRDSCAGRHPPDGRDDRLRLGTMSIDAMGESYYGADRGFFLHAGIRPAGHDAEQ